MKHSMLVLVAGALTLIQSVALSQVCQDNLTNNYMRESEITASSARELTDAFKALRSENSAEKKLDQLFARVVQMNRTLHSPGARGIIAEMAQSDAGSSDLDQKKYSETQTLQDTLSQTKSHLRQRNLGARELRELNSSLNDIIDIAIEQLNLSSAEALRNQIILKQHCASGSLDHVLSAQALEKIKSANAAIFEQQENSLRFLISVERLSQISRFGTKSSSGKGGAR